MSKRQFTIPEERRSDPVWARSEMHLFATWKRPRNRNDPDAPYTHELTEILWTPLRGRCCRHGAYEGPCRVPNAALHCRGAGLFLYRGQEFRSLRQALYVEDTEAGIPPRPNSLTDPY